MSVTTLENLGRELAALMQSLSDAQRRSIADIVVDMPRRLEIAAVAFYPKVLRNISGKLFGAIAGFMRRFGGNALVVGLRNPMRYAAAQEYGADIPPHGIEPRFKQALYWPGAEHPVKRVHHPGGHIKPKRFLRHPLLTEGARMVEDIAKKVRWPR